MAERYLIGIDIGTYESKGVLTDTTGRVIAQAVIGHELSIPQPGWVEHDAETIWWHDFVSIARDLLLQSGVDPAKIAGVGCSAIAPCVLPVDKTGRPLRPGILYGIDTRASVEVEDLTSALGAEWIISTTGSALSSQSAGPKILWLQRNEPGIWAQTHRIMTSTSYLVYRLTGRIVIDHYTATTFAPLYDLHELGWEPRGMAEVCPADMLPDLDWTTAIAGRVTAFAAEETGLAAGTPVIVGTADAAAEAVSAGVVSPGDTMLMYGTTLFFIEICEGLPKPGVLWPAVYLEPGTFALAAGMSTAGAVTRWFRDQFGQVELLDEASGGPNAYAKLAKSAQAVPPGAEGLLVLPYFSGERTPLNDPLARGMIAGLTLSHTKAHIYRGMLEGIAYGIRHNLEAMKSAGDPPAKLIAIGGGTKNRLWLQIVSDVTGQKQVVRTTTGASYGDAFLAGVGVGLFQKMESVRDWLGPAEEIAPNPTVHDIYNRYYPLFRQLYDTSRDVVHALALLPSES